MHDKPTATGQIQGHGSTIVHAIWNGATQVVTWEVQDSSRQGKQQIVTSAPWDGLDTTIVVGKPLTSVRVIALDVHGNVLGRSPATPVLGNP